MVVVTLQLGLVSQWLHVVHCLHVMLYGCENFDPNLLCVSFSLAIVTFHYHDMTPSPLVQLVSIKIEDN